MDGVINTKKEKNFLQRIKSGERLVSDGAMGTMLFERGLRPGECPEELNLSRPQIIQEVATAYINAGADIVETNTFGASSLKLADYKLQHRVQEINRAGVDIVRQAAKNTSTITYIAGTIGPTGKILKPYGDTDPALVRESYFQQIMTLISSDVDIILMQTMSDLQEISLAVSASREAMQEWHKDIPLIVSLSFNSTPRGFFTMMGVSIEKAVKTLSELKVDVVGSNCGNGIDTMVNIAAEFRRHTDLPLMIESNAGLPDTKGGKLVYHQSPEMFFQKGQELIDLGVNIIGGCCGSTPEHIMAIKKLL
ncbi:MAG: homocysteine S-methyltransferase family protein [Oligoflexia bacterium]|nr:homocysteine S-methyltransferase family protein [Oligoflexia bacterium]